MLEQPEDLPSLEALQTKIDKAKPREVEYTPDSTSAELSQAMRFTIDLSAGVIVGCLIGYGIDIWLETLPWGMIVCLFLGMAAGIRNMMASAKQLDEANKKGGSHE